MKYRTLVGFSGVISAPLGAVIELDNELWERDLVKAGYIEPFEVVLDEDTVEKTAVVESDTVATVEVEESKPKGRGRGKKNEG